MIGIPPKGGPERDRLIAEHKTCIDSMKGVAGCSILRCATPGDTTVISGGIHDDSLLHRVLIRMRAEPTKDKLVVICTKVEQEWRIARLAGVRGVPPEFVTDKVYDNEHDPQHDIFLIPNPPKDTDGRREDSGRVGEGATGEMAGLHWGRLEVGGRSSVAA